MNLLNAEPKTVWKHFTDISKIPRCSKNEERVRTHVIDLVKGWGYSYQVDKAGNLCVKKPASSGRESAPGVVLQGHLDMVCEKNQGTDHDFSKDPLDLYVEDGWLKARGTTLGADNGIAVAMMLAILEDKNATHGPLEALFTIDEETGLTGATDLDASMVDGRILINLDGEEEGIFYIGCAGGKVLQATYVLEQQDAPEGLVPVSFIVKGLNGGHSGADIHKELGNACSLAGRLAWDLFEKMTFLPYAILGGGKHNAIPRECKVLAYIDPLDRDSFDEAVENFEVTVKEELGDIEPGLAVVAAEESAPGRCFTESFARSVLRMMAILPHGVAGMSRAVPGLVETSSNFASIETKGEKLIILASIRSSVMSQRDSVSERVRAVMTIQDAKIDVLTAYPSWKPDPSSDLTKKCVEVFESRGGKAEITAIHAGLECGIIGDKLSGMKMISFGPEMAGVHTPEEKLSVESTERTYAYLRELLAAL